MPKYTPTAEDIFSTKPCAVCGRDVIADGTETCSEMCEQQWQFFKDDYEEEMMKVLDVKDKF